MIRQQRWSWRWSLFMKRRAWVLAVWLLTSAPSVAQTVAGDRFQFNFGPCVLRNGLSAPEGAVTGSDCDVYFMTTPPFSIFRKQSGGTGLTGWIKIPDLTQPNTFTAAQTIAAALAVSGSTSLAGATMTSATISSLVAGRVTMASTLGLLVDDPGLVFAPGTGTLTATRLAAPSLTPGRIPVTGLNSTLTDTPSLTWAAPDTLHVPVVAGLAGSNLALRPAGDLVLDPTGNDVLPQTNYDINLGALTAKYLTVHGAELWVETLVAQNTMATIGGRILVAPTNILTVDMGPANVSMVVKYNSFANGDRFYMEADGKVEWFAVASNASGTAGAYIYSVARDLDGSGTNQWYAGDAQINTGQCPSGCHGGYIDLFSTTGVLSGAGPTIVGNVRTGNPYNALAARWAIGNLNGQFGYGVETFGAAFGDPVATNVTVDATSGFRIRNGTTEKFAADPSGNLGLTGSLTIGPAGSISSVATSYATGTGYWLDYNGGVPRFRIGAPAGDRLAWNGTNLTLVSSTVSIDTQGITVAATNAVAAEDRSAYKFSAPESGRLGMFAYSFASTYKQLLLSAESNNPETTAYVSLVATNHVRAGTAADAGVSVASPSTGFGSSVKLTGDDVYLQGRSTLAGDVEIAPLGLSVLSVDQNGATVNALEVTTGGLYMSGSTIRTTPGSAGDPGLSFSSATGLYQATSGVIAVALAGAPYFAVDSGTVCVCVRPGGFDNYLYLGSPGYRWRDIYAVSKTSVLDTSWGSKTALVSVLEGPEYKLYDSGTVTLDAAGSALVTLDPHFVEVANLERPYQVTTSGASVRAKTQTAFTLVGPPNTSVDWGIFATRAGFENVRWREPSTEAREPLGIFDPWEARLRKDPRNNTPQEPQRRRAEDLPITVKQP